MARSVKERFDAKVDRSGVHHLWLGATKADGSGLCKLNGRVVMARRVAWELANGDVPAGARVLPCAEEPGCVRTEHLAVRLPSNREPNAPARRYQGTGSLREIRKGVWELAASAGNYEDGGVRRIYKRLRATSASTAARELAAFVNEVSAGPQVAERDVRKLTMNEAIELFLVEHLSDERGRDTRTITDYRKLHDKWFSPAIGRKLVRNIDEAMIDRAFGRMRKAGLSRSRLNQAKSLYVPFFRWAKSRKIITRNPMIEFQLPTSEYVSKERTPPEIDELCLFLRESVEVVPDVAPLLALGAVTGMRRGELVGLRRSRVLWEECRLTVDAAVGEARRVKGTKTRKERSLFVDDATMAMLQRHCDQMDERAAEFGVDVPPDAFVFSLAPDCVTPMPPDFVTKRVGVLKDHLGIADKHSETVALEAQALRLYRQKPDGRRAQRSGPAPKGGMSFREIGERLDRSERWATLAVASAERREAAKARGLKLRFDGSILALRKFTSSELLDAGFNVSMVAQRQGHGPEVLVRHYSKSRRSADRRAADHLGRVVHGQRATR